MEQETDYILGHGRLTGGQRAGAVLSVSMSKKNLVAK